MNFLSAGPVQTVLGFLNNKEGISLAKTCKNLRNEVEKNKCQVLSQGVWSLDYPNGPGSGWENVEHVNTKQKALDKVNELQKDPKVTLTVIYKYYADLGWVANRPEWTIKWNRDQSV